MIEYHHIIQVCAALTGMIFYRRYWAMQYKLLVVLATISAITEISAAYIAYYLHHHNTWLYNLFIPVQAVFVTIITFKLISLHPFKKIAVAGTIVYAVVFLTSYTFAATGALNSTGLTITLLFFCFLSCLYVIDLLLNNDRTPLSRSPGFWFILGLLFMSVLFICRFSFYDPARLSKLYLIILDYFIIGANTFLYGGIILCFICLRLQKKTYLPS